MSISKEAKEISAIFRRFKGRPNTMVYNFNNKSRYNKAQADFVDHLIITPVGFYFLEVKLKSTKDKQSKGQSKLEEIINKISNDLITTGNVVRTHYGIITSLKDAEQIALRLERDYRNGI